jgi:transcription initiation factor IIF auxiliary subunit
MREWSIEVYVVGPNDEQLPATCFEKVTYRLHESFGKRATQSTPSPFRLELRTSPLGRHPC